jgi:hypothetical protein
MKSKREFLKQWPNSRPNLAFTLYGLDLTYDVFESIMALEFFVMRAEIT